MAKKEKEGAAEAQEEKQEPVKPSKPRSSEIKLPVLIGVIFGILIVFILSVRFLILPYIVDNMNPEAALIRAQIEKEQLEKEKLEKKEGKTAETVTEGENGEFAPEDIKVVSAGKIITNPKNSKQFVVTEIALKLAAKFEEIKDAEEKKSFKEGKLPGHIQLEAKDVLTKILSTYSPEELNQLREKDSLKAIMKEKLKPMLKEKKITLVEILIPEFIIQ